MNLISAILRSTWMIDEQFAIGHAQLVQKLLEGKSVDFSQHAIKSQVSHVGVTSTTSEKSPNILVIPVKGVIMKEDYCGDMGMRTLNALIKQSTNDSSIDAIIMDFDTPGGDASYLDVVAATIREAKEKKDIHAFVQGGIVASAGYFLASQCTSFHVGSQTDRVGSIGTMIQFMAQGPKSKENIVVHTINATKSTDKNREYMEAESGKYDLIRTNLLDPFNENFHSNVRLGRPDISEEVFSGKMYFPAQAIELGMIDGVMSWEELVDHTLQSVSNPQAMNNFFNTKTKMKNEKLSAILGRDVSANEKLSAEDMTTISAHIIAAETATATASADLETANSTIATLQGTITEMEATAATNATELAELQAIEARLAALEGKPGASPANPTPAPAVEAEDFGNTPWENPNDPLNAQAAADLGL